MHFTFSLLKAFSQRSQNTTAAPQDVRELTLDELDQVYGGHGKDCHQSYHHKHHYKSCDKHSHKECNNYCDYSYYDCYTY